MALARKWECIWKMESNFQLRFNFSNHKFINAFYSAYGAFYISSAFMTFVLSCDVFVFMSLNAREWVGGWMGRDEFWKGARTFIE